MIIGVDLDGVVYDFVEVFARWIHREKNIPLSQMLAPTKWDFWSEWGLEKEQWLGYFREFCEKGGFVEGGPIRGAKESLQRLSAQGHHIRIVTARGHERREVGSRAKEMAIMATARWLSRYEIPYVDLFFTNEKTTVVADVYIDDAAHHLEALRAAGRRGVCFDRQHNREWKGERVKSWAAFEDFIASLEKRYSIQVL